MPVPPPNSESLATPLAWADSGGRVLGCNPAFASWLGVSARLAFPGNVERFADLWLARTADGLHLEVHPAEECPGEDPATLLPAALEGLAHEVRNPLASLKGAAQLLARRVEGDAAHRLALRVEISDDGRGVPEDLAERIFLPLVSGRAEGTGLGLPLAQQVAREHRGSLGYRSRPGHTVFTLLIPVPDEAEATDAG